jgi:hypothetical protein
MQTEHTVVVWAGDLTHKRQIFFNFQPHTAFHGLKGIKLDNIIFLVLVFCRMQQWHRRCTFSPVVALSPGKLHTVLP